MTAHRCTENHEWCSHFQEAEQRIESLKAALARTQAGLRLFTNYGGTHHMWCAIRQRMPTQACTCGLHELQVEFRDTMTEEEAHIIMLVTSAGADAGEGRDT